MILAKVALGVLTAVSASAAEPGKPADPPDGDSIGAQYVKLVLAVGQHDPDYVDAFYGPAEWKSAAEKEKKPLEAIATEAAELHEQAVRMPPPAAQLSFLHREYLIEQLSALQARVRIVKGERLNFDEESRALYGAVAPTLPESHFQQLLDRIAECLSSAEKDGKELPLWQRYERWRKPFMIPKEKLDAVFQLAIKECRARTLAHVKLPPDESFTVEYVTDKPWGGYNWYQGNYRSVIQVNTDLPIYIDRAIDLAAHEGYPGHHVYNALLEKNLVRDRGWVEFTVYPLFSPQSLIAEGAANFGKELLFTKEERMKFEREVLFPAAGIDPARAEEYYKVEEVMKQLGYAGNEAARRLINGEIEADAAAAWLEKYAVMEPPRARQRVKFIQRYRSYVINYNLGEDMVRQFVDETVQADAARAAMAKAAGRSPAKSHHPNGDERKPANGDVDKRWEAFEELLSSPRLPSGLR